MPTQPLRVGKHGAVICSRTSVYPHNQKPATTTRKVNCDCSICNGTHPTHEKTVACKCDDGASQEMCASVLPVCVMWRDPKLHMHSHACSHITGLTLTGMLCRQVMRISARCVYMPALGDRTHVDSVSHVACNAILTRPAARQPSSMFCAESTTRLACARVVH